VLGLQACPNMPGHFNILKINMISHKFFSSDLFSNYNLDCHRNFLNFWRYMT
jgi:hypothetical protein